MTNRGIVFSACLILAISTAPVRACDRDSATPRNTPYSAAMMRKLQSGADAQTLILGDSIAARLPTPEIERIFSARVLNVAVGGDRIENTRSMLDAAARPSSGAVKSVILIVGTNNVRDDACAPEKAGGLLATAHKTFPEATLYVVSVLPKGRFGRAFAPEIEKLNHAWRQAATETHGIYVDASASFSDKCAGLEDCPLFRQDRVHPSESGYKLLTEILARSRQDR